MVYSQETIDQLLAQGIGGEVAKMTTAATTKANSGSSKAGNGGKRPLSYIRRASTVMFREGTLFACLSQYSCHHLGAMVVRR